MNFKKKNKFFYYIVVCIITTKCILFDSFTKNVIIGNSKLSYSELCTFDRGKQRCKATSDNPFFYIIYHSARPGLQPVDPNQYKEYDPKLLIAQSTIGKLFNISKIPGTNRYQGIPLFCAKGDKEVNLITPNDYWIEFEQKIDNYLFSEQLLEQIVNAAIETSLPQQTQITDLANIKFEIATKVSENLLKNSVTNANYILITLKDTYISKIKNSTDPKFIECREELKAKNKLLIKSLAIITASDSQSVRNNSDLQNIIEASLKNAKLNNGKNLEDNQITSYSSKIIQKTFSNLSTQTAKYSGIYSYGLWDTDDGLPEDEKEKREEEVKEMINGIQNIIDHSK